MEDMNSNTYLSQEEDKYSQELANNLIAIEHKIEEKKAEYNKLIESEEALTSKINNLDLEIQEMGSEDRKSLFSEKTSLLLEEYNEKDQLCKLYTFQIDKLQQTIEQCTLEIEEKGKKLEILKEKYFESKEESRTSDESQETLCHTPIKVDNIEDQNNTISKDDIFISQEIVELIKKRLDENLAGISDLKELVSSCENKIFEKEKLIIEAKIKFAENRGKLFQEVSNRKKIVKESIKKIKKPFSAAEVLKVKLEKTEAWIKDHDTSSNLIELYKGKVSDLKTKIQNIGHKVSNIRKKRQRLGLAKIERQTEIESIEMEIGMAKAKIFEDLKS